MEDFDSDAPVREREPRYFTVRVYLQDMAYGGPEEGGWYFNTGEFAPEFGYLTRCFKGRGEAVLYADHVHTHFLDEHNKGRRPISSVLSQGRYKAEVWEEEAPLYYPTVRPHYE